MTNSSPSLTIDFSEIENGMDIILSMAKAVKTRAVRDAVVKNLTNTATDTMLMKADETALAGGLDISHMYEWGKQGDPKSRLFNMRWIGSGDKRSGYINFTAASMEIPVPISRAHQAYVEEKNAERSPDERPIRLAQYVWLDKAMQLETSNRFVMTPQGASKERDGWVRTRPGSHTPAKSLMVEVNGEIEFFRRFTQKYGHAGNFTAFFNDFWDEGRFEQAHFNQFSKRYYANVSAIFSKEILGAKIAQPAFIPSPGIHLVSNGRRRLDRVSGRERQDLIRKYEKLIVRSVARGA